MIIALIINLVLYSTFLELQQDSYQTHPFYTINNPLNDTLGSDCQDRTYYLGNCAIKEGYQPKLLLMFWWKHPFSSHVCLVIDGRVWDATWTREGKFDYWDYTLDLYLEEAQPDIHVITPFWVSKILR